ncbi:mitogen-activated protein kinase kinase kinase kinase 5-like [Antedon mediterranea]|uniref:mitogen-activated protein kinase kinase kinase kinase 5-like n=1 Tax=Antedon mediterranea TaxID=105859 RepID=UPI003AF6F0BD
MSGTPSAEISRRNPTDDFELLQRIGSGTYGDVYKARMITTGDLAAIKVIKIEPGDDFTIIQQEILMMKDCKHENIVGYFGSYLRRDKLWIAMEYCGGGSLQDIYHQSGELTELQIAYVCRETLTGLAYMHNKGKMHRDIKGANILLTNNGDVKLADFGVSAQITQTIAKRKSFIGTPYWMAPEVAAVERKGGYNYQCDIWAVGITAIELAELQPPMFDLHPMRALFLMSKSNFVPPKLKDSTKWSREFRGFIKCALVKNPKRRPTADVLLKNPFFTGSSESLNRELAKKLLEKVRNSNPSYAPDVDEEELQSVPQRVSSKHSERRDRPVSEINLDKVRQALPMQDIPQESDERNNSKAENGSSTEYKPSPEVNNRENRKSLLECVEEELSKRGHTSSKLTELEEKTKETSKEPSIEPFTVDYTTRETLPKCGENPPPLPPKLSSRSSAPPHQNGNSQISRPSSSASGTSSESSARVIYHTRSNGLAPKSNGESIDDEEATDIPKVPPRKAINRFHTREPYADSKGLPKTPKVTMGACFSKIFNECPLNIHCSASWVHPEKKDQYVLFGADEGIYAFNLTEIHEGVMDQIFPRKTTWIYVVNNMMMSLSGKAQYIYSHNLLGMIDKNPHRFHMPGNLGDKLQKIPDKLIPRKYSLSHKVSDTKGCTHCCAVRNPYNGHRYLGGAIPNGIVLLQWYEPMNKFLQVKIFDCMLPPDLKIFEMLIKPESEYPIVCIGVARGADRRHLSFDIINLNSASSWFVEHPPQDNLLDVVTVSQLEKDTVLVCSDRIVQVVNLNGRPKSSKKLSAELHFDFPVEALVVLQDSVLAFHKNGMQGRSFKTNEVTQEICDKSKMFTLLGSERLIILKSSQTDTSEGKSNVYLLTGHENTM